MRAYVGVGRIPVGFLTAFNLVQEGPLSSSSSLSPCTLEHPGVGYLTSPHLTSRDTHFDSARTPQVMGGVSESNLRIVPGAGEASEGSRLEGSSMAAVFSGEVRTANAGGFVSVRTRNASPPTDLSAYNALKLRVKGDGNRYKFSM